MRLATSPRSLGPAPATTSSPGLPYAAIVGMGYVGLPTGIGFASAGFRVTGIDSSEARLEHIQAGELDISPAQRTKLDAALSDPNFALSLNPDSLAAADVVVICVPTPVDERPAAGPPLPPRRLRHRGRARTERPDDRPDEHELRRDDARLPDQAARAPRLAGGQGRVRGVLAGADRPRQPDATSRTQCRASSAVRPTRARDAAARFLDAIAASIHRVSSPEAAELTKLYENTFRAVNIAFANEMADASRTLRPRHRRDHRRGRNEAVRVHAVRTGRRGGRSLHPMRPALPASGAARAEPARAGHRARYGGDRCTARASRAARRRAARRRWHRARGRARARGRSGIQAGRRGRSGVAGGRDHAPAGRVRAPTWPTTTRSYVRSGSTSSSRSCRSHAPVQRATTW